MLLAGMDPATISPTLLKQDKGPLLVIIIWFFASLALVVVSIKVWTRLKVLRKPGLEDLFVLLAWVSVERVQQEREMQP